jgi:hypothetical protein
MRDQNVIQTSDKTPDKKQKRQAGQGKTMILPAGVGLISLAGWCGY